MSIRMISALTLTGLLIGGLISFTTRQELRRVPASTASSLSSGKAKVKPWADSLSGKMNQALTVRISAVGGVPEHDNQELKLRAEVTLNRPFHQDVHFQWQLPGDVSVVAGEREDAWQNLLVGQTVSTDIVLMGISKESVAKTVTLHVSSISDGINFGASGSFATNSVEDTQSEQSVGVMSNQNSKLGLKKTESAAKIKKLHQ